MRVVLDTNVFVSAVLGPTLQSILAYWRSGTFTLIVSDEIVQEYLGVLRRPKFRLTPEIIDPIMAQIFQLADFVAPDVSIHAVQADPSDNKFLEVALAGKAIYIVSGDNHLLDIKAYQDIRILTAREFISILEQAS
jgi:putative PIN family toxin of toxin-antitoxin system